MNKARCWVAILIIAAISPAVVVAQENRNHLNLLLSPTSRDAHRRLQQSCSLFSMQPLRSALREIALQYDTPIWLDRRIDPEQILALSAPSDSPAYHALADELQRVSTSCGLHGGLVENIFLIAPQDRLARIQRSAVVLHGQLASSHKTTADQRVSLTWPDISSSQELLTLIQQTWNVKFDATAVPHDLFHQGQLPPCALATQLSLVLGGFDLQAVVDPSSTAGALTLKLQPLAAQTVWQDVYTQVLPDWQQSQFKNRYPDATLTRTNKENATQVRGETNLHIDLLSFSLVKKPMVKDKPLTNRIKSFEIQAPIPIEAVLENLGRQLNFTVEWSDECTAIHRNRLVQLKVTDVTRTELLERLAAAANLQLIDQTTKLILSP